MCPESANTGSCLPAGIHFAVTTVAADARLEACFSSRAARALHTGSQSDLFLKAGLSVARALCVRTQRDTEAKAADFSAIDEAILRIQHSAESFDDLEKMTTTIQNNSGKILKKLGSLRKSLEKHVEILEEKTAELKSTRMAETRGNRGTVAARKCRRGAQRPDRGWKARRNPRCTDGGHGKWSSHGR